MQLSESCKTTFVDSFYRSTARDFRIQVDELETILGEQRLDDVEALVENGEEITESAVFLDAAIVADEGESDSLQESVTGYYAENSNEADAE